MKIFLTSLCWRPHIMSRARRKLGRRGLCYKKLHGFYDFVTNCYMGVSKNPIISIKLNYVPSGATLAGTTAVITLGTSKPFCIKYFSNVIDNADKNTSENRASVMWCLIDFIVSIKLPSFSVSLCQDMICSRT